MFGLTIIHEIYCSTFEVIFQRKILVKKKLLCIHLKSSKKNRDANLILLFDVFEEGGPFHV